MKLPLASSRAHLTARARPPGKLSGRSYLDLSLASRFCQLAEWLEQKRPDGAASSPQAALAAELLVTGSNHYLRRTGRDWQSCHLPSLVQQLAGSSSQLSRAASPKDPLSFIVMREKLMKSEERKENQLISPMAAHTHLQ